MKKCIKTIHNNSVFVFYFYVLVQHQPRTIAKPIVNLPEVKHQSTICWSSRLFLSKKSFLFVLCSQFTSHHVGLSSFPGSFQVEGPECSFATSGTNTSALGICGTRGLRRLLQSRAGCCFGPRGPCVPDFKIDLIANSWRS